MLSGSWADTVDGSPFIIDSNGVSYPLVGPEAADKLGFRRLPCARGARHLVKLFDGV